jgi:hypothetical protein
MIAVQSPNGPSDIFCSPSDPRAASIRPDQSPVNLGVGLGRHFVQNLLFAPSRPSSRLLGRAQRQDCDLRRAQKSGPHGRRNAKARTNVQVPTIYDVKPPGQPQGNPIVRPHAPDPRQTNLPAVRVARQHKSDALVPHPVDRGRVMGEQHDREVRRRALQRPIEKTTAPPSTSIRSHSSCKSVNDRPEIPASSSASWLPSTARHAVLAASGSKNCRQRLPAT